MLRNIIEKLPFYGSNRLGLIKTRLLLNVNYKFKNLFSLPIRTCECLLADTDSSVLVIAYSKTGNNGIFHIIKKSVKIGVKSSFNKNK